MATSLRGRGSFRSYTLLLMAFYLVLVFFFHSGLQPDHPRGLSAHERDDEDQRPADDNAAAKALSQLKAEGEKYQKELAAKKQQILRDHFLDSAAKQQQVVNMEQKPQKPRQQVDYVNFLEEPPCQGPAYEGEDTFDLIANGVHVYSLYWDTRTNDFDNLAPGGPIVRMMAILDSRVARARQPVYCVFEDGSSVEATYYEMCENHNRQQGGWILSCRAPRGDMERPCSVAVSPTHSATDGFLKKVHPTQPREGQRDFSICVSPLYGSIHPLNFIEWVEQSRQLGAQHITIYDFNVDQAMTHVLRHYSALGVISVVPWRLPAALDSAMWYHGQLVAVQDCLYRNMGSTRYVAMNDIDEFIVPHTHATWRDLVAAVDNDQTCGFQVNSAFFDPGRQEIYTGPRNLSSLFTVTDTKRSSSVSKIRTKCMLKPQLIFESGIHHISKPILASLSGKRLAPPAALLHHYRSCMANYGMSCHQFEEDDTLPRNFANTLFKNVAKAIGALREDLKASVTDEAFLLLLDSNVMRV